MDTIKEYLVSLGFEADDKAYRQFSAALAKASSEVHQHTNIISNAYVKASSVIAAQTGAIITSTVMLLDTLAKADMGYQTYAMRMYMARDAAKEFNIVTKAMGNSLEEIAWVKELNQQYKMLMADASRMELPKSYREQMEMVRGMRFEFTRLKVEATYSLQWIGHELIKNLIAPMGEFRGNMKEFNDYIIDKMPKIGKKIADVLTDVFAIFRDSWKVVKGVTSGIKDLWNILGDTSKILMFIGIITAAFAFSGPFVRMIMILTALPILINEFYSAMSGGRTAIPVEFYQGIAIAIDGIARVMMGVIALSTAFWAALKGTKAERDIARLKIESAESEMKLTSYTEKKNRLLAIRQKRPLDVKEARDLATYEALETKEADEYNRKVQELNKAIDISSQSRLTVEQMIKMRKDIFDPNSPTGIRPFYEGSNLFWNNQQRAIGANKENLSIEDLINEAAKAEGIRPNVLRELIRQESGFDPRKVSPKGAMGLTQLMPDTAKELGVNNPFDVRENIFGGARYLSARLKENKGNYSLALAAYNAGQGAVNRYGGIPPYKETQNYVSDIMRRSNTINNTYTVNIDVPNTNATPEAIGRVVERILFSKDSLMMGYAGGIRP